MDEVAREGKQMEPIGFAHPSDAGPARADWLENWHRENAEAIPAYNLRIGDRGVYSEGIRLF